jgi:peptidoglycan/LPS O-acetylase OafA/YrhL
MTLAERLSCRDNNLNAIRLAAAIAVLVSHAWPLTQGKGTPEPLEPLLGVSLGHVAVLVFFAASGYLIAGSFDRRTSLSQFVSFRIARLAPGLAVSLVLVAFVMGPAVTTLPLSHYLADPDTWGFVPRNLSLVLIQFELPGVFTANPYPIVEGSIWTLKYEVACYALLTLAGVAGLLARRGVAAAFLAGWLVLTALVPALGIPVPYHAEKVLHLSQPFALGMILWLWRERVGVRPGLSSALLVGAVLLAQRPFGDLALAVALAHATLTLAALPVPRPVAAYDRLGDWSYGVYVYAVPVQGLAVWTLGPQSPLANIAFSLPLTLALAALSWRWVEAPALALTRSRARSRPARGAPSARPAPHRSADARPLPPPA